MDVPQLSLAIDFVYLDLYLDFGYAKVPAIRPTNRQWSPIPDSVVAPIDEC